MTILLIACIVLSGLAGYGGQGWFYWVICAVSVLSLLGFKFGHTDNSTPQAVDPRTLDHFWLYRLREQYGFYNNETEWQIVDWLVGVANTEAANRGIQLDQSKLDKQVRTYVREKMRA